jgi:hypothetical protein
MLFGLIAVVLVSVIVLGMAAGGSLWKLACPAALMALGGAVLVRYFMAPQEGPWDFKFLGDVRLKGKELAGDREVWVGIGDIRLDLRDTELPAGETNYRILGLIGDIEVRLPPGVGLSVDASGLINDIKILDEKHGGILAPVHFATADFESAERKVRLDMAHFIGDLKVKPISV